MGKDIAAREPEGRFQRMLRAYNERQAERKIAKNTHKRATEESQERSLREHDERQLERWEEGYARFLKAHLRQQFRANIAQGVHKQKPQLTWNQVIRECERRYGNQPGYTPSQHIAAYHRLLAEQILAELQARTEDRATADQATRRQDGQPPPDKHGAHCT